ncbi:MAG: hypothetical protein HYX53_18135 [Chloroflexi bacterium]|nr:hypothetical protein [Chloroflexota bacterium]
MAIEAESIAQLLRLAPETDIDVETLGPGADAPVHATLFLPGALQQQVLVRGLGDEDSETHASVLEALGGAGFAAAPRLLAAGSGLAIEEWAEGLTALAAAHGTEALERVVATIAALHALPIRAGARWELPEDSLIPGVDVPLHRLGFAAHEREAAAAPIAAAREALRAGPFGFVHGRLTAGAVVLTAGGPVFTGFAHAGAGHQLCDLAAFLVTAGLGLDERGALGGRYAAARGLEATTMQGLVELAGLLWGMEDLLTLPRRLIEALGDDPATHRIQLEASRIEAFLRERGGPHPAAMAIRAALWRR